LIALVAEDIREGLIGDGLGEEERAVDLLRPQVAEDVIGDVRSHRVGDQLLDTGEPLGEAPVHLAEPDVAGAAVLDVSRPLPVRGKAHEGRHHAFRAHAGREVGRVHPFWSDTSTVGDPRGG
jgi:hypothetical protein